MTIKHKNYLMLQRKEAVTGYLFIAPQMILFAVFLLFPVFEGIRLSLYDASFSGSYFVGLDNYKTLLGDEVFVRSIINTLLFVLSVTVLTVGGGFFVAVSIFDKSPKYVSFIRACYYLPAIIGMTVLSLIWLWMLNPAYGVINHYLVQAGFERVNFVGDSRTVLLVLIVMSWFYNIGQAIILYLASMAGISVEILEASDIDGASRWQKIRFIVWPLTGQTTVYLTILCAINVIRAFVIIHLMTAGGPNFASVTMMYLSYLDAFKFNHLGRGSAIGVLMFIIVWILSMFVLMITKRKD